jgi:glucan 1,3-beta-glucosidase
MWMMPFQAKPPEGSDAKEIKDHVSLWSTIEKRLGKEAMYRMRAQLRENWITEADFDRLRVAGFNSVRLPFLYDSLEPPDDLFFWLDKGIEWASKRGMYVVIDMHGAPGRQSKDHHSGEENVNRFFFEEANVRRAEEIWAQIARRYRDRPAVAAFNLLNEPMGAPNHSTLHMAQDRLYRAIRAVDDRHIIIIEEGYKGVDSFPLPSVVGWKSVALSFHSYRFDAKSAQDQFAHVEQMARDVNKLQKDRPVPFYLGEWNMEPWGNLETMSEMISTLDANNWSWSIWTYKVAGGRGGRTLWGLINAPKELEKLDPFRDSEAEWARKVAQVRTENMMEYPGLADALKSQIAPEAAKN